jgi:hypothetical protein
MPSTDRIIAPAARRLFGALLIVAAIIHRDDTVLRDLAQWRIAAQWGNMLTPAKGSKCRAAGEQSQESERKTLCADSKEKLR